MGHRHPGPAGPQPPVILQYYYGDDIEIVRTSNIASIPESYPGSPVRQGDRGSSVFTLQRQLNRITKDYPFFGTLEADGIFGSQMAGTVQRFQRQFNLTADGVVGRQTWYKISYIYVSVKDLAELTSEGETASGILSDGSWGGTTPAQRVPGQRGGAAAVLAQHHQPVRLCHPLGDGGRPVRQRDRGGGPGFPAAVRPRGGRRGGRSHLDAIYAQFFSIQSDNGTPNAYPGTALRQGDEGQNVRLVQFWLKIARTVYTALNNPTVDGRSARPPSGRWKPSSGTSG